MILRRQTLKLLCMAGMAFSCALAILEGPVQVVFFLTSPLFFMALACVYKESWREWLSIHVPGGALFLFFPIFYKSPLYFVGLREIGELLVLPVIGMGIATLLVLIRVKLRKADQTWDAVQKAIVVQQKMKKDMWKIEQEVRYVKPHLKDENKLMQDLVLPLETLKALASAEGDIAFESKRLLQEAVFRLQSITQRLAGLHAATNISSDDKTAADWVGPVAKLEQPSTQNRFGGESTEEAQVMELLENIWMQKQVQYCHQRITFDWKKTADSNMSISTRTDKNDLQAILLSVLDMAVESLGGGPGVIRLSTRVGLRSYSISIEDNGRGFIPKRNLAPAMAPRLSLEHMKALVEFWGGRLECLARLGVGTRITVELPRTDAYAVQGFMGRPQQVKADANHSLQHA